MQETVGSFTTTDGLTLFERSWWPDGEPRAVIAVLHGGAEHGGRYEHLARELTGRGHRVDALDQRSHGRSQRVRGVPLQCDDFGDLVEDAARWLDARPAGVPLFVVGHSMGGLVAVALAVAGRLPAAGLVTLGAALRITPPSIVAQATLLARTDPDAVVVPMGRSGFDASTRDATMRAAVLADPVHADVTGVPAGFLATTAAHAERLRGRLAAVTVPLLAMHGTADLMADPRASADLVAQASSPDATLELVPDGYHALVRDLDRGATISTIAAWIEQRLPAAGNDRAAPS